MEEEDETAGQETTEFLESLGIEADSLPGLASSHPKNRAQLGNIETIRDQVQLLS